MALHKKASTDIDRLDARRRELAEVLADETRNDLLMRTTTRDPVTALAQFPAYDRVARVGAEQRTYHRGADPARTGKAFLWDVTRSIMHQNPAATERVARHQREEEVERGQYLQRAAGTGAFAGLVVPQYLTELYAPA